MVLDSLSQYSNWGFFILRLSVAIIFLYHAYPKLTKPAMMAKGMGWSASSIMLLGFVEAVGALSVLFGVYTQAGALLLGLVMIGAIYFKMSKWKVPFSAMDKMGWEFDLILLAASIAILFGAIGTYVLI